MTDAAPLRRVFIACRGILARRLIAFYRALEIETVVAFSDAEVEASWVETGDFDAYLGDAEPSEAWRDAGRLVSAAMDAGCDALHPGQGAVADRVELYALAQAANLAVLAAEPTRVVALLDRPRRLARAHKLGLSVLPFSEPLVAEADGIEVAARIGLPLQVVGSLGPACARVERFEDLAEALAAVRLAGDGDVLLQSVGPAGPRTEVVVVADRSGRCSSLGAVRWDAAGRVARLGPTAADAQVAVEAACALIRDAGFVGVAGVSFRFLPGGVAGVTPWLSGLHAALPDALDLVERVQGVDLVAAQHAVLAGEPLPWSPHDPEDLAVHGALAIVRRTGPGTFAVEGLPAAADVLVTATFDPGETAPEGADDVLLRVVVFAASEAMAATRLREVLGRIRLSGVPHDLAEVSLEASR